MISDLTQAESLRRVYAAEDLPWTIGLMTGTVLDGFIDIALLRTNGEQVFETGPYALEPYDEGVVPLLQETLQQAKDWQFKGPEPDLFAEVQELISRQQAAAIERVLTREGVAHKDVGLIGFHGQSVLHRAPRSGQSGKTRQLGDGALMAGLLEIPVAWDFRTADVSVGGQGAPLAPVYHHALLTQSWEDHQIPDRAAVVNLGGVGNITAVGADGELQAFDTGPANAPINDWMAMHSLGNMDSNGELAAAGKVDEVVLAEWLDHPYFTKDFPKSLDRFDFGVSMMAGLDASAADGAALLTAFSAAAVGKALDLLPVRPECIVLCGGGRHNPTLVREIENRAVVKTVSSQTLGWRGDAIEAECFAYLAVRVLRDLPLSFPTTTGVARPCKGGRLSLPRQIL